MTTVPEAYLAVAVMALVGIGFPVMSFIGSGFLRPRKTGNDPNKLSSWLLPGYESDQSLYVRRESTYECGSDPVGDAHINFHFQYYWYAIIFLVFDIIHLGLRSRRFREIVLRSRVPSRPSFDPNTLA